MNMKVNTCVTHVLLLLVLCVTTTSGVQHLRKVSLDQQGRSQLQWPGTSYIPLKYAQSPDAPYCPGPAHFDDYAGQTKAPYVPPSELTLESQEDQAQKSGELIKSWYLQRHCSRGPNSSNKARKLVNFAKELGSDQLELMANDIILEGAHAQPYCSECGKREIREIGKRFARRFKKEDNKCQIIVKKYASSHVARTITTAAMWADGMHDTCGKDGVIFEDESLDAGHRSFTKNKKGKFDARNPQATKEVNANEDIKDTCDQVRKQNHGDAKKYIDEHKSDFEKYILVRPFDVCKKYAGVLTKSNEIKKGYTESGEGHNTAVEVGGAILKRMVENHMVESAKFESAKLEELDTTGKKVFLANQVYSLCLDTVNNGRYKDGNICSLISGAEAHKMGKGNWMAHCYKHGPCAEDPIAFNDICPLAVKVNDFLQDPMSGTKGFKAEYDPENKANWFKNYKRHQTVEAYFGHAETLVPLLTFLGFNGPYLEGKRTSEERKEAAHPSGPEDKPNEKFIAPSLSANIRIDLRGTYDTETKTYKEVKVFAYINEKYRPWPGAKQDGDKGPGTPLKDVQESVAKRLKANPVNGCNLDSFAGEEMCGELGCPKQFKQEEEEETKVVAGIDSDEKNFPHLSSWPAK